ncbi:MAG: fused MFS/spermidine synthase [Candidatus Coatesbacteria bacterium]
MNAAILALFSLSGWCALTYQVIWTRWLGLTLGTFEAANATVTATFMAGLAIGYRIFGRPAARREPGRALFLYGGMTAGLAGFALLSPWLLASDSPVAGFLGIVSSSPVLRAAACASVLLPPTILMGGTLPVMLAAYPASPGGLARLYAANTIGAAVGPLTAGFVLVPAFGLAWTARTAGAVEALVAVAAIALSRRFAAPPVPTPHPASVDPSSAGTAFPALLAFSAGALSLAFEISLVHLVVLTVTGGSVYGLSLTLAAYLGGMGAGAWAISRWPARSRTRALIACAAALVLPWAFALTRPFWGDLSHLPYALWRAGLPFAGAKALEFCLVFGAMLPVAAGFGIALPALAVAARADEDPGAAGRLFAANTAGAVIGAPIAGFLLLPGLGLDMTLAILGGASFLAATAAIAVAFPGRRYAVAVLALSAVLPLFLPPSDPAMLNVGGHYRPSRFVARAGVSPIADGATTEVIRYEHDGLLGHVAVRDSGGRLSLVVNGKPDSSNDIVDATTMVLNGALPLLLHPGRARVLIVGLGAGITAGVALRLGAAVTCAEIDPGVVEAARCFDTFNNRPLDDPRFRLVLDDGRHFLRMTPDSYDVIISEPSNLYVAGTVNLFTVEYFRLVRSRLAAGGLLCLWMHYYGAGLDDLRTVIRTVASVFPELSVWINRVGCDIFVIAGESAQTGDWYRWKRVLTTPAEGLDLNRIGIASPAELANLFLFGSVDARAFAGPGTLCTDDRPTLEFTTPLVPDSVVILKANRNAFDTFPVTEPVPLAGASGRDRREIGAAARAQGRTARAAVEERAAGNQPNLR